jgi:NAD(P)-dependent dehydrogenase (short-subunit alcohol dehydrogenase family)
MPPSSPSSSHPAIIKRIFLTGASAGIGLATARALTAAGCHVWGTSRKADRLPTDLPNFHPVILRLGDEESMRESFANALKEAGERFDVLINNAGGGWFGPAAEMPGDALRAQFQKLVFAPFTLIQLALPTMRREPGGLIINVTSLAGRLPLPYSAAYSAAKAAMSTLTATMQMEERDAEGFPAHFVDLQPGDINTDFNRSMNMWQEVETEDESSAIAARRVLAASDESMGKAPPPELVAECIRGIIMGGKKAPAVVTCGNFWQARLGPLAARFLPPRLLQWTIRRNFGL